MCTIYKKQIINKDIADSLYLYLKDNIVWEDAYRSSHNFTRKAKPLNLGVIKEVDNVILFILNTLDKKYKVKSMYINYYVDGTMFAPEHRHVNNYQLVLSLGETRTLTIEHEKYRMESGDVILFGGQLHSVPKEDTNNGRISITAFLTPQN